MYESEEAARADLDAGKLQGYYVLESDYLTSSKARLVYVKEPKSAAKSQFYDFLLVNLLASQPPDVSHRLIEGNRLTIRAADGSREMGENSWFNALMPFFGGFLFLMAIFTSSGYLLQAVTEEKENRTMEVVITSVSPSQLMVGKIIGDIGIGLTQIVAWVGFIALAISIGSNYVSWLQNIAITPSYIGVTLAVMVPAWVLLAGLMATVGSMVTESQEGQQVVSLFSMPIWFSYWFASALMTNPNSALAVGLSFFPLTAPTAVTMRAGFTDIPLWQLLISQGILWLSALGMLWLAGRAFRLGMLRYGQRLPWRELLGLRVKAG
jgi:ABC-2 type transport system permease protein